MLSSKPEHFMVKEGAINDNTKTTGINCKGKPVYLVALAFRVEINNKGSPIHREISTP